MLILGSRKTRVQQACIAREVDWSHPLASELAMLLLPTEGLEFRDVVNGGVYRPANGSTSMVSTPYGPMMDNSAANYGLITTPLAGRHMGLASSYSIFYSCVPTATSQYDGIPIAGISYDNSLGSPYYVAAVTVYTSGGNHYLCHNFNRGGSYGAVQQFTKPLVTGQYTQMLAGCESGSQLLYVDGLYRGFQAYTGGAPSYSATAQLCLGTFVLWGPAYGLPARVNTQAFALWNRKVTDNEAKRLWDHGIVDMLRGRRSFFLPALDNTTAITGSTGITSLEAFSVGIVAGPITGAAGIASGEVVDPTGAIVAALVYGTAGITTAETFGSGGVVAGPITGTAGIPTAEAFGAGGLVVGPIVGTAGIATAETFGTPGRVTGLVVGAAGIVSAETFGSGGVVAALVYGSSGITTAEAFGSGGTLTWGIAGYQGIGTEETFGRAGLVTHGETLALYIRGKKRAMRANTLNVQGDLNGRYVASFELIEYTGARPNPGDEVIYTSNGVRRFAGFVQTYKESFFHARDVMILKVTCVDYKRVAEERTFGRVYSAAPFSSRAIVKDIFDAVLKPEGFTWSYDDAEDIVLSEGDRIAFEDETVATCLDRLAGIFGFDWFITFDRVFKYERNRFSLAPRNFRDNDGLWRDMEVERSDEQYRNRQGARTSVPTSGQRVSTIAGNGSHSYYLGWPITDLPKVTVNTTQQTVINYADRASSGPWVFAYEVNSNLLRHNPTLTAYTSSDAIMITAPSATIDVYFAEDNPEIARQAARSGGTGIREAVTKATNIRDKAVAASFTQSMIDRLGRITEVVTLETDTEGWYVGQMVSVITSRPRVNNWFVVQSVTMREVDISFLRYQLKLSGKQMPLIQGITVTPISGHPGEYELGITIDRGVDGFSIGQPFEIAGIDGSGYTYGTIGLPPGPYGPGINGTWVVEGINTAENIVTCTTEGSGYTGVNLGLGTFTYTGGAGGTEGGGGEIPFGGTIVPTNPGLPGNNTESIPNQGGPLIVVGVDLATAEVTTDHAHGLTTGTSVMIAGVSGCDGSGPGLLAGSINNSNTRITVTSATKFIAEDVFIAGLGGAPGFVNDRHGRVIPRNNVIRFTQGVSTANILNTLAGAATGAGSNLNTDTATFILSNSIPGISSRPLQVVAGATNPWVQQADIQVVTDVSAILGTPATGRDVIVDVLRNGVSLFASGGITIPAGSTELVRSTDLAEVPTTIVKSDILTVNVTQVGSDFAGCDATVQVNLRG